MIYNLTHDEWSWTYIMPQFTSLCRNVKIAAGSFGVLAGFHELNAKPYEPTCLSVLSAANTIARPAIEGLLLKIRHEGPGEYIVSSRELLKDTKPHVSNVNNALEKAGVELDLETSLTILRHDAHDPRLGSPLDRANEEAVIERFRAEYQAGLEKGRMMPQSSSSEDFDERRKANSYALLGIGAHQLFLSSKIFYDNLMHPPENKAKGHERAEQMEKQTAQVKGQLRSEDLTVTYKDRLKQMRNANPNTAVEENTIEPSKQVKP